MPEEKIYVPRSSAKEITFQKSGKTILKIGFHADTFIDFIRKNTNAKGYINLGISARREVGQHGDTHCVWLDTWQPGQTTPAASPQARAAGFKQMRQAINTPPEDDDVPF